jgi:SAM-dependent methyltransferase
VALGAQLAGAAAALAVFAILPAGSLRSALPLALLQGGVAAAVAAARGAPRWWWLIHAAFAPLVVLALRLPVPPLAWLAAFALLVGVFWRTDVSRVPLYLSNRATADALAALLPPGPCRVVDLGCGSGGLLLRLAAARPDASFIGVEHAPLPWLVGWLRARHRPNVAIHHGDLWRADLASADVVYAFLSPAPMERLWAKACAELSPGAVLVANSFPVPGVEPARTVDVGDRRGTRLFVYRAAPARR